MVDWEVVQGLRPDDEYLEAYMPNGEVLQVRFDELGRGWGWEIFQYDDEGYGYAGMEATEEEAQAAAEKAFNKEW